MPKEEIFNKVKSLIQPLIDFEIELKEEHEFQKDIGLDSMALFKLAVEVENHYDIFLQDSPQVPPKNIGELVEIINSLSENDN